jgi:hypothetical protein
MLAEAGYDPMEMARFFEKLGAERGGGGMPAFFSSHPAPENRVGIVQEEIQYLPKKQYTKGSSTFQDMKKRAEGIKPSKKPVAFQGAGYEMSYPDRWQVYRNSQGDAVTIAPAEGILRQNNGATALAAGILAGYFSTPASNASNATDAVIRDLQAADPNLQVVRNQRHAASVSGQQGESVLLEGSSPYPNQRELVWLVATRRPQGVFYVLMVAPESSYNNLRPQYEQVVDSVRFP